MDSDLSMETIKAEIGMPQKYRRQIEDACRSGNGSPKHSPEATLYLSGRDSAATMGAGALRDFCVSDRLRNVYRGDVRRSLLGLEVAQWEEITASVLLASRHGTPERPESSFREFA